MSAELYTVFEKENHLKPNFDKSTFEAEHLWDFGWSLLETINIANGEDYEPELSKRFSPGQKALYFFWYLDAQVMNGGFIQFYVNGYRKYLNPIIAGLQLVEDTDMLQLVKVTDKLFLEKKNRFDIQLTKETYSALYKDLTEFEIYNDRFHKIHDNTMALIEQYCRDHVDEFVSLK